MAQTDSGPSASASSRRRRSRWKGPRAHGTACGAPLARPTPRPPAAIPAKLKHELDAKATKAEAGEEAINSDLDHSGTENEAERMAALRLTSCFDKGVSFLLCSILCTYICTSRCAFMHAVGMRCGVPLCGFFHYHGNSQVAREGQVKCVLKDRTIHMGGRDYLFNRCTVPFLSFVLFLFMVLLASSCAHV
ncbi:hypothetical protein FB451DRAFT_1246071 [Mycena latifolia]|nr:hypothetical protein FB451DRAFT_1246071 [Mycena latifolia]